MSTYSFPLVGHTHNDVDWMFGIIAQKLKRIELPSFEILKEELSKIVIQSKNLTVTLRSLLKMDTF